MNNNNTTWAIDQSIALIAGMAERYEQSNQPFKYDGQIIDSEDVADLCASSAIIYARFLADLLGMPPTTIELSVATQADRLIVPYQVSFKADTPVYFSVLSPLLVEVFEVDLLPLRDHLEQFVANAGQLLGVTVQLPPPIVPQSNPRYEYE